VDEVTMRHDRWWTVHLLCGLVVLVGLAVHMAAMHLDALLGVFNRPGTEAVAWVNVVDRAGRAHYLGLYVVLLAAALVHGLYGLRGVLAELHPPAGFMRGIGALLWVVGVGLFALGAWAAWTSFALARSLGG